MSKSGDSAVMLLAAWVLRATPPQRKHTKTKNPPPGSYPSGRIALTVCRSPNGFFHTFTSDSDRSQVLGCFDADGVGGVNHPDGRPW